MTSRARNHQLALELTYQINDANQIQTVHPRPEGREITAQARQMRYVYAFRSNAHDSRRSNDHGFAPRGGPPWSAIPALVRVAWPRPPGFAHADLPVEELKGGTFACCNVCHAAPSYAMDAVFNHWSTAASTSTTATR